MVPYDIAIIGVGCVFPGANDAPAYWRSILSGECRIHQMPQRLWRMRHYLSDDRARTDKSYTAAGCFVEDFEFPFAQYKLPPNSLKSVDPVQLVALEATKQALVDAGMKPRDAQLDKAVTVIGTSGVDEFAHATVFYRRHLFAQKLGQELSSRGVSPGDIETLTEELTQELHDSGHLWNASTLAIGAAPSSISNRLAQVMGARGFNLTVDGACSSSLIAVDVACQALMAGDARVAIAGGADMGLNPAIYIGFSRVEGLSLTGTSNPFDASADGLVMGEGVGILILKRLEDALADGDRVRAVIRTIGSSSDGAGQAIYAPSVEGRIKSFENAFAKTTVQRSDVQYIEAHATSTVVGDANEYDAISSFFGRDRGAAQPLYLGSVKHQIGHLKAAAGAAGLIKTVLAMDNGIIPHLPRFKQLTPGATQPNPALRIPTAPLPWTPLPDGRRVAAVTTSGFGGINYHCVLEQSDHPSWPEPRAAVCREMAVVGVALRIPGADNLDTFWDNLTTGKNVFATADLDALGWNTAADTRPQNELITTRTVGRLSEYDFNPLRYKLFPSALSQIAPTQLLALSLADQLLESHGLTMGAPKNIGASIGSMHDDYFPTIFMPMLLDEYAAAIEACAAVDRIGRAMVRQSVEAAARVIREASPPVSEHTLPGWMTNITTGRLSNKLNLRGPTFVVDSACSSGLSALLPAIYQLMFGTVDVMVTGGVNRQLSDVFTAAVCQLGAMTETTPRPFDKNGNGFIVGEGGVLYLLKRHADAKRDGDHILAVIHALSGSSEADSKNMVAPSEVAVRRAIRNALEQCKVSKQEIAVVDTHGSANPLSDIVEAHSLAAELRDEDSDHPVRLTAMKSHVGHLYGGSGASSLLSVIQSLRTSTVPGIRNLETPMPEIADVRLRAAPQKGTAPLPLSAKAGGVNSLGLGGTNYFAVVTLPDWKESTSTGPAPARSSRTNAAVPLAATSPSAPSTPTLFTNSFIEYLQNHEPAVLGVVEEVHHRYLAGKTDKP